MSGAAKAPRLAGAVALVLGLVALTAWGADVELGDKEEDVRLRLGVPQGEVQQGDHLLLIYDRGTIDIFEGHVVKADLVSERDREERERREKAVAERQRLRQEQQRRKALLEGQAAIKTTLADEAFLEKPAVEQVRYWDTLKRKYPGVTLPAEYEEARKTVKQEQAAERERLEQERLAAEAAAAAKPKLSASKERKEKRRLVPGEPVKTAPYTVPYRRLGGNIERQR
jgi:hypothetical protein